MTPPRGSSRPAAASSSAAHRSSQTASASGLAHAVRRTMELTSKAAASSTRRTG
ncbi:hypothetical protein RB200_34550 [Streptomyces sp. PmtG]